MDVGVRKLTPTYLEHAAPGSMGNSAGCPIIRDSALESLMLEKVVDLLTETEASRLLEDRESGHYIL